MPSSDQIRAKLGLGPRPKPMFGHNRSHALNATRKISKPNLQNKWVMVDGQRYRIKLTAREMRTCLLYTSPSPRDRSLSRMPSSA